MDPGRRLEAPGTLAHHCVRQRRKSRLRRLRDPEKYPPCLYYLWAGLNTAPDSLPNTKIAEDFVKKIICRHLTGDFAESEQSMSDIHRHKIGSNSLLHIFDCLAEAFLSPV